MSKSLAEILHGGRVDAEEVRRVSETLIFEREQLGPKFLRVACLLVLAASIALFGFWAIRWQLSSVP